MCDGYEMLSTDVVRMFIVYAVVCWWFMTCLERMERRPGGGGQRQLHMAKHQCRHGPGRATHTHGSSSKIQSIIACLCLYMVENCVIMPLFYLLLVLPLKVDIHPDDVNAQRSGIFIIGNE